MTETTRGERGYLDLMQEILDFGAAKGDRTGTGTRSVFGRQLRFNLADGFPLLTTKRVHLKSIIYELLWFMQGNTDVGWLQKRGVSIWDEWVKEDGSIGPGYGHQWRSWPAGNKNIDQLQNALKTLMTNHNCRRNIVCSWNVGQLEDMALPPCHLLFQFYVAHGRLSCQLYQRSCDYFLGVPFNIASYSLLTMIMAKMAGLGYGEFIWTGGDVHLYKNHFDQARLQLSRKIRPCPVMFIPRTRSTFESWEFEDFNLVAYQPHPSIKAPVAV